MLEEGAALPEAIYDLLSKHADYGADKKTLFPGYIVEPALPPWQGDQLASSQSVPGCRYIMGAYLKSELPKTKCTGARTHVAA